MEAMGRAPLLSLKPMYLVFTDRPGVLRALRSNEKLEDAQGMHFTCPQCKEAHGMTFLFDMQSVPKKAKPDGRYEPSGDLFGRHTLQKLTIKGKMKSPYCSWTGFVTDGEVFWKRRH